MATGDLALSGEIDGRRIYGAADLTEAGVAGDRILQVRNKAGRIMTARTRPLLLRHRAVLGPGNRVLVDGRPGLPGTLRATWRRRRARETRLVQSESEDRFDILPLLVATDGTLAAVGYDTRRFRPNLVIGGVPGLCERQWEGARLRIGRWSSGWKIFARAAS